MRFRMKYFNKSKFSIFYYLFYLIPFTLISSQAFGMKQHIVLELSAEQANIDILINDLFYTSFRTKDRSSMKMPFNEFLVKGDNQITLIISPNIPAVASIETEINIKIIDRLPGSDSFTTLHESEVKIKDLKKTVDNAYKLTTPFKYNGFDVKPWLDQLSPLTKQEVMNFAQHAAKLVEQQDLDTFMQLFLERGKVYSQAYDDEYSSKINQLARTIKSTFMKSGLEKSIFHKKEFVIKPYFNSKLYTINIKPDYSLDINKELDKSDLLRKFLISKRTPKTTGQFSLECSIVKYQGKLMFFI